MPVGQKGHHGAAGANTIRAGLQWYDPRTRAAAVPKERPVSDSTEDFAAMFEASLKTKRIEQGQTIEGTIVAIGPEVAFVDVGGKGEATIEVAELKDEDGDIEVAVGDRLQAVVISTAGGLTLSRKLARGAATARQLEDAFHSRLPVEGRVEKEVKGGYEVRVGGQRAFCPFSQIDIGRTEPTAHLGKVYTFRVIEYREGGRNLIVSRRAILDEEQRAAGDEIRKSIVEGAVLKGRVATVRQFGAFVDLGGGVQGLLHVSEMGWSRIADPSQVVAPGDEITVKVLKVDAAAQKISLGLKQLADDPWSKVSATYEVGQVVTGRVTRVMEFGAFVELEAGIEALAHASTFAPTGGSWRSSVRPGTTGTYEIVTIDPENRRIGVAPVTGGGSREAAEDVREYREREDAGPSTGLGSLGDRLRGAIDRRKP
jgi:small subunit ribosomal protein S1